MRKKPSSKPTQKLLRWRVSLITATPRSSSTSRWAPDAGTAEAQVAQAQKISDALRDQLLAVREDW
jgi:hypothetical protein